MTDEVKSIEDNVPVQEAETKVEPRTQETEKVEEASGLSLRDALEVAHEASKDVAKDSPKAETVNAKPEAIPTQTPTQPSLEAPAEWNKDEKEAFRESSRKQQEAALRLHNSRNQAKEEIKVQRQELEHLRKLNDDVIPYLKALGVKETPGVALQKALKMWREFEEAKDPKAAAAAYLEAKGVDVPKEFLSNEENKDDSKIAAIQEELNSVKHRLATEDKARVEETFTQAWRSFEAQKNAAGKARFPDINDTDSGLRLSSNIGSLVGGQTELSRQFITSAKERIPDLTWDKLLFEAYKFHGGRPDDSEAPRSQSQKQHIAISRRAASSVPGRGSTGASTSGGKKFNTYREAAEAALAQHRESEGA